MLVSYLRKLELGVVAQAVGGVAWTLSPFMLVFLSSGQYENHIGFAFPMVLLGVARGGPGGLLLCAAALLASAFATPYQIIPVGIVAASAVIAPTARLRWAPLAMSIVALGLCGAYFGSGPQPRPGSECAPSTMIERTALSDLVRPGLGLRPDLPPARVRLAGLWQRISRPRLVRPLNPSQPLNPSSSHTGGTAAGYLGIVTVAAGLAGFLLTRRRLDRPLWGAGLACFILGLGPRLVLTPGWPTDLPLPWSLARALPGVGMMGSTQRFLSGTAFVLVVGVARLVQAWLERPDPRAGGAEGAVAEGSDPASGRRSAPGGWGRFLPIVLLLAALVADWMFLGLAQVPISAARLVAPAGFAAMPSEGAVLGVPVRSRIPPEIHQLMWVVHRRPYVGYCREGALELARRHPLVQAAMEGGELSPAEARRDLAALKAEGIGYVAFVVPPFVPMQGAIYALSRMLGPPDASGDGVVGYRTGGE
jgi:hypothetical protein